MTQKNANYVSLINSIAAVVIAVAVFLLPVFFLTNTTEFFIFPKQILIITITFLLLTLYCIKSLIERRLTFVKNPLNLPIATFAIIVLFSSYMSPSSIPSVPQAIFVVGCALLFFAITNIVQEKQNFKIILLSLLFGTLIATILSTLASFGIHLLPFEVTKNELFNTFGSSMQMIGFVTPLLILSIVVFLVNYRKRGPVVFRTPLITTHAIAAILFSVSIGVAIYQITSARELPVLLPFDHGFQLALASISQDASRMLPSFLFGSGYGMFSVIFTKFHLASFNALPSWSLTFAYSSSFVLELIATTGILGILSYFFIIVKFVRSHERMTISPLFLSVAAILILSFLIPFSFPLVALIFILMALYIVSLKISKKAKSVEEIVVSLVTNGGFLEFNEPTSKKSSAVLPIIFTVLAAGFIAYVLFFFMSREGFGAKGLYHYVVADMTFAKSLQPEALTDGQETYDLQIRAIQTYPYRADFYRIFSQINLALATNLVNSQQDAPTVSEDIQEAILQQLQQAINASRQSVIFAPESALNWRNLGQIYRNLIGVGQDAEQFAIASYNQAIALEPTNPALRIELGGIYYQLNEYNLAQQQFQLAIELKRDYANAYYNLGHTLEEKGDLATALQQYQIVAQLVTNDDKSIELINQEIATLQTRIGEEGTSTTPDETVEPTDETELNLSDDQIQFPERNPREEIQGPPGEGDNVESPITPAPTETSTD